MPPPTPAPPPRLPSVDTGVPRGERVRGGGRGRGDASASGWRVSTRPLVCGRPLAHRSQNRGFPPKSERMAALCRREAAGSWRCGSPRSPPAADGGEQRGAGATCGGPCTGAPGRRTRQGMGSGPRLAVRGRETTALGLGAPAPSPSPSWSLQVSVLPGVGCAHPSRGVCTGLSALRKIQEQRWMGGGASGICWRLSPCALKDLIGESRFYTFRCVPVRANCTLT